jgi:hypothetical protein
MNPPSHPITPPAFSDDDIRAYAEHLYEQSGRVPNRDIENWLEAKACLEAGMPPEASLRRHRHLRRRRRQRAGAGPLGFTMPPSDASLWIDQSSCD